jgi:hypothetical protein
MTLEWILLGFTASVGAAMAFYELCCSHERKHRKYTETVNKKIAELEAKRGSNGITE